MDDIDYIFSRLKKSKFRLRFRLSAEDMAYVEKTGLEKISLHARDFIEKRLAPLDIKNDGKQTPFKGHPVFKAQHATATCCRSCLLKWHHIQKGRELTESEKKYCLDVITRWITAEITKKQF